eukprot:CAMPEP_0178457240 /NCGR_PEP_ID=MMETSP0689_2-20121128/46913_1 /TAXON_ID=160604 /ORGANISM="Amphidinium massartii, Strain CS-259" /LENGTH=732 /DNA_ID=CAMNT_0020083481 /DNA_START=35 /DNA_END=2234 /DNA_ORIENTATION=+
MRFVLPCMLLAALGLVVLQPSFVHGNLGGRHSLQTRDFARDVVRRRWQSDLPRVTLRALGNENFDVSVPTAWQDLLRLAGDEESNVVRDGVVDFTPWFIDDLDANADPSRWEEDGVLLGNGAFGKVVRAVDRETGELVAIKRIPPTHPLAAQTVVNELQAAKAVGSHKYVVQLKAAFLHPEQRPGRTLGAGLRLADYHDVVLVYRLALGGALNDWIDQQHSSSSFSVDYMQPKLTDESLRIMTELVEALQHVHRKGVQHRDLKPANILLTAGATALIADFGIALVNRSSTRLPGHAALGDFYFIDVESLVSKGLPYTLDDDVFSLGEVMTRILYGKRGCGNDLYRDIMEGDRASQPRIAEIVCGMLHPRGQRWSLEEVLKALKDLKQEALYSDPRPIVTEVFLGVGAIVTAATVGVRRQPGRSTKGKMADKAKVYIGRHQGHRASMQDEYFHSRVRCAVSAPQIGNWRLLGVFDGHGGELCSQFCARFLPMKFGECCEAEQAQGGMVSDALMRVAGDALAQALESLDGLFVGYKQRKKVVDLTGSTASVALLSPLGEAAAVCNIGDSRVALAGGWEVIEHRGRDPHVLSDEDLVLTGAHTPADPDEQERIKAAGGFVEYGRNGYRVNGVLAVSRALGYAGSSDFAEVISAKADTMILRRPAQKDRSAAVMIATDGMYEKMLAEELFLDIAAAGTDGAAVKEKMNLALGVAGGLGTPDDNATILTCVLPPAPA